MNNGKVVMGRMTFKHTALWLKYHFHFVLKFNQWIWLNENRAGVKQENIESGTEKSYEAVFERWSFSDQDNLGLLHLWFITTKMASKNPGHLYHSLRNSLFRNAALADYTCVRLLLRVLWPKWLSTWIGNMQVLSELFKKQFFSIRSIGDLDNE